MVRLARLHAVLVFLDCLSNCGATTGFCKDRCRSAPDSLAPWRVCGWNQAWMRATAQGSDLWKSALSSVAVDSPAKEVRL